MTAPVSLAEVRTWIGKGKELDPCSSPLCNVKECRMGRAVLALLDIAEAAQALDTALLHDAVAGDQARTTLDDLDEALAEVRP